jgi:hypothetical protein
VSRQRKLIAVACIAVVLLTAATPAIWDTLAVAFEPVDPLFAAVVAPTAVPVDDVLPSASPVLQSLDTRGPPSVL